jgi:hypothetical protein
MNSDILSLHAQWGPREESAEACAQRVARMLRDLAHLDARVPQLIVDPDRVTGRAACEIPTSASDIVPLIEPVKIFDEGAKRRYRIGFRFAARREFDDGSFAVLSARIGAARVSYAGAPSAGANELHFSRNTRGSGDADMRIRSTIAPGLEAIVNACGPDRAGAFSYRLRPRDLSPASYPSFYSGSFIAYLTSSRAKAAKTEPPLVAAPIARGLLFCATTEPFDHLNPAHLHGTRLLYQAIAGSEEGLQS